MSFVFIYVRKSMNSIKFMLINCLKKFKGKNMNLSIFYAIFDFWKKIFVNTFFKIYF